jgi:hypothetical protein
MIVEIKYVTKIPSDVVKYSVLGYGGSFNGGEKSTLVVSVNLSVNGAASMSTQTRTWGPSRKYNDNDALTVSGKPDWFRSLKPGAPVLEEAKLEAEDSNLLASWAPPTGASHGVKLMVDGGNPLITLAPGINGELIVGFRNNNGHAQYIAIGDHDGFPDHRLLINGVTVHAHDCVAAGKNPGDLAPIAEDIEVSINDWRNV